MSYEPTNWQTGDIVTAEKLNKLENGVADSSGGILAVNLVREKDSMLPSLDKTYAEIESALKNNKQVVVFNKLDAGVVYAHPVLCAGYDHETYNVRILIRNDTEVELGTYVAEEEDSYPIIASLAPLVG